MKLLHLIALIALLLPTFTVSASAKTYDRDYIGEIENHRAVFEDTLVHLARDNSLGFVEVRAANPDLDPWIPGAGAKVVLPKQHILPEAPRNGIVINLPEMRLYFYKTPGEAPQTYPIGIGREGLRTPTGSTTIVRTKKGPTWTPTQRMLDEDPELETFYPAGPDNPMGTHAMYLGWPTYAIHGTNKPYSIGRGASSGCIRLYPEGIVELFPQVKVGTKVTVVDQAVKAGWIGDKMYIEVHPTQDQSMSVEEDGVLKGYEITADDMKRITAKAGEFADYVDWKKVREAVREHKGYPVAVLDKRRTPGRHVERELDSLLDEADASPEDIQVKTVKVSSDKTSKEKESEKSAKEDTPPKAVVINVND